MNKQYRLLSGILLMMALLITACTGQPTQAAPGISTVQPATATSTPAATATTEMVIPGGDSTLVTEPTASVPEGTAAAQEPSVNETLIFSLNPGEGKARYRVREQLVNFSLPNDAVGETDQISGSITILPDGTVDTANSRFEVNLSTLASDQARRDNYLRNNVLQTDQFPTAVFVPKSIAGLTWPLAENGDVKYQITGDLTIRDVTREVTWDVTGTLVDGLGTGQAVTSFTFADFNLTQPRVPVVLSIEDEIILEVDGAIRATSEP